MTFEKLFRRACKKRFKRLTIEEFLAVGAWSDFMARGGPGPVPRDEPKTVLERYFYEHRGR